ncbi:bifunctional alpha,alpha-trehalose-phosphate synthase (UDP-forming)/trehalose-phosphatase [Dysgonomonas sp. Marseille-P4677]|uniref:bifunctional alpha,alpha-trehalose-phosphate synthase (UDP-forming)/trehalose-phosphatase n=1 Tax=Dysgonomonas sp. Marseille-P4677 TaxID=2364790 RepID=UPI001914AFF7|nr:bifunctional alpha,alpha-trehalose-phosphate synthase (UDP-forming)/trehalose-phosphatase [Dysgonomonas sp. Marseille-P4677]MBK5722532.1 bifunctional alpha,alpha-trehalose-phosphate synthase (UDP-forming)/trehalose-phosphatase [Dysgonomonas sp. Marseille-P4677]
MKLIIISNRLPLKIIEENNRYEIIPSPGGLSTGLDSLDTIIEKHWIGWPGMYLENSKEKEEIDEQLEQQNFHPVYLSPEQIENYYEGYSNSVLWPLCHYFSNYVHYENKYWEAYKEVNLIFCKAVLDIVEPGDIVWVQDYQLMLLPKMLRDRISDISIGYFHHIPFPSYELFRGLPERAELLNGLLGADLVAFHTHSYMRHFISAVYRVLKLDCNLDEIQMDRRVVDVDAFPMGINYDMFHNALLNPDIKKNAKELRTSFGNGKLILSVDRLDYSKGIMIRLKSFENLLENYPEYLGQVSLVMIVAPSRDNVDIYAELKNEIDMKVGAINGKYSSIDWTPVYYFYRAFNFEELTALYHIADIALVTPIRDGMNLVAKEYISTKREGESGVLILSEMAGASIELSDAIIVNPTDTKEIEQAIVQALKMPIVEQLEAIASMQEIISTQTVRQWAKDFIEELTSIKLKNDALQQKIVEKTNFDIIKQAYDRAKNRLIILDYDGTLAPFHKEPMQAYPTPGLINILEKLSADIKNHIVISSGRSKQILDKWLGHLPIGLAAEHGAFYKEDGIWHRTAQKVEWDNEIPDIIKQTIKRTPRSKMEVKDTALVWHYRNVDVWLADLRVTQLINALLNPCARHNLQIMKGNKIVEVKSGDISKGSEANRLINKGDYDFIMAIGDDTTDEEMFMALPQEAITIKVGQSSNAALYNLPTQQQTLLFLLELIKK